MNEQICNVDNEYTVNTVVDTCGFSDKTLLEKYPFLNLIIPAENEVGRCTDYMMKTVFNINPAPFGRGCDSCNLTYDYIRGNCSPVIIQDVKKGIL